MQLLVADYILIAVVLGCAIMGIFKGLSGSIAFLVAAVAAAGVGMLGWRQLDGYIANGWIRGIVDAVIALIVFGVIRMVITKAVHGLLAQPADAIFGFLVGAIVGVLPIVGWSVSGFFTEYSTIVTLLSAYIGQGVSS